MKKSKIWAKLVKLINNHTDLLQLILLLALIVIEVVCSFFNDAETDITYIQILTLLIYIAAELFNIIIMLEKNNTSVNKTLQVRSTYSIQDFVESAKNEVYITGVTNTFAIHTLINYKETIKYCLDKKIHINLLFFANKDDKLLNWYFEMHSGKNDTKDVVKRIKMEYIDAFEQLNSDEILKALIDKELLKCKCIDIPVTTAFVACDINDVCNGKIQCLFYQYNTSTTDCPTYLLEYGDEMYDKMKEILCKMWESADDNCNVYSLDEIMTAKE